MAKQQKDKKDNEITVVAEFELTSSEGVERVKGFCASWVRLLELPVPAQSSFVAWVRKD